MSEILLTDLAAQVKRHNVVAIVGAGVSLASTGGNRLASWRGLLEDGIEWCVQVIPSLRDEWRQRMIDHLAAESIERWLEAAEGVTQALLGPTGGEYKAWLRHQFETLRYTAPELIRALHNVSPLLLTTNYDGLLEQVTDLQPATWRDQVSLDRMLRGEGNKVVHLHGYWEQPESVVLGIRSYDQMLGTEYATNALRTLVSTKTLLFVGFGLGLEDPNFSALRQWMKELFRESAYRHYRLATNSELEQFGQTHPIEERISLLAYGDDYSELPAFLDLLRSQEPARKRAPLSKSPRQRGNEEVAKPRVAISMGDASGIGPEIILKALRTLSEVRKLCIPIVVGSTDILESVRRDLKPRINVPPIRLINSPSEARDDEGVIWVLDVPAKTPIDLTDHFAHLAVAELSIECTRQAIAYGRSEAVAAVISGPVSKEACFPLDSGVRGHTELIAKILGLEDYGALYLSPDLAIATVTGHCRFADILGGLTKEQITKTIVRAAKQLKKWRPDAPPRIGVCSINPHAGEGGSIGSEDQEIVLPAIRDAKAQLPGLSIDGPLPADSVFRPQIRRNYGLIVAMYHDQGKVAAAAIDPNTFVAVMLGSPVLRTTVTHGTAFDIAGRGSASSANLISAIEQAVFLSPQGEKYLATSPEVSATKFYSVAVRLNSHTKEKNLVAVAAIDIPEITQFFHQGGEELRVVVGPGSTPTLVVEHLIAWVGGLTTEQQRPLHIVTDNLEVLAKLQGREFRGEISVFGGRWDQNQNSLGPSPNLDALLARYKCSVSIVSCSGLAFIGGETRFYSYTSDHSKVLSAILRSHKKSQIPPEGHPLVVVATGEKVGNLSTNLAFTSGDLPENTILLLENEREIQQARGRKGIDDLVSQI